MATRKRKKTRQQSQNAIMNWIVLFLVAAAAIQNFNSRVENPESAPGKEDKSAINLPSLEQLKQARAKILPGPDDEVLTLQDVQPGSGAPASCGQQVSVAYTTFDEGNVPLDDTASKESPLHFTIGQKKVLPALDEGVMGMKPGGLRKPRATEPPAAEQKEAQEGDQVHQAIPTNGRGANRQSNRVELGVNEHGSKYT